MRLVGSAVVLLITAAWTVFTYFHKPAPTELPHEASTVVSIQEMHGGNIAGRDQHITNIEGISEDRFQALSEELGVTKAALKSFFKLLKEKQVPPEDLDETLRQIAHRYKDLEAKLRHFTSKDPEVTALKRQAKEALEAGEFDRVEELLNQAKEKDIQGAKEFQNLAHTRLLSAAATAAEIAELKNTQLAYAEAAKYYRQAAQLVPKEKEKLLAKYLNLSGIALTDAGRYAEAESLFKRSLAIWEKALGPDHPDVAISLNNLGLLYQAQGRYAEAKPFFERSLAIREKEFGPDHPDVANSLNNLGLLYKAQGRYAEAEPLLKRSLAIREKALGQSHPNVAIGLNNLAKLYQAQGKYAQAEPLYRRALAILKKALGSDHPNVAIIINNLAELCKAMGREDEALLLKERAAFTRDIKR